MGMNGTLKTIMKYLSSEECEQSLDRILKEHTQIKRLDDGSITWLGYRFTPDGPAVRVFNNELERNLVIETGRRHTDFPYNLVAGLAYPSETEMFVTQTIMKHLSEMFPKVPAYRYCYLEEFETKLNQMVFSLTPQHIDGWKESTEVLNEHILALLDSEVLNFIFNDEVRATLKRQNATDIAPPFNGMWTSDLATYNLFAENFEVVMQAYEMFPIVLAHWLGIAYTKESKKSEKLLTPTVEDSRPLRSPREMASVVRRHKGMDRAAWARFVGKEDVDTSMFSIGLDKHMIDVLIQSGAIPSKTIVNALNGLFSKAYRIHNPRELKSLLAAVFRESDTNTRTLKRTQKQLESVLEDFYIMVESSRPEDLPEIPAIASLEDYISIARAHFDKKSFKTHEEKCKARHGGENVQTWTLPLPVFKHGEYIVVPVTNRCQMAANGKPYGKESGWHMQYFEILTEQGRQIALLNTSWFGRSSDNFWARTYGIKPNPRLEKRLSNFIRLKLHQAREAQEAGDLPESIVYLSDSPEDHCPHCGLKLEENCDCPDRVREFFEEKGLVVLPDFNVRSLS